MEKDKKVVDVVVKVKGLSVFGENKIKPKEKENEHSSNADGEKNSTEAKDKTHGKT